MESQAVGRSTLEAAWRRNIPGCAHGWRRCGNSQIVPMTEATSESEDRYPLKTNPLDGYAIVHFGNDWRAENRTSSHHISEALSRRLPVLYVSTPGFRAPSMMKRDIDRIFNKLREAPRLPERVGERMWTITMPQLPFSGVPGVGGFNLTVGRILLRRA